MCWVPACNTSTQALSGEAGGSWVWSEPGLHSLLLLKEWGDRACLSIAGHEGWQNVSPSPQLRHQAVRLKATSTSDFFDFMTSLCLSLQLMFKSGRHDCCRDMMSVTAQQSTFFCLVVLMEGGIGPFVCNEVIGWLSYYGQIRVLLLKVEYSRDESIKLPGAKWRPIFIIAVNSKNEHSQWIRHSGIIRQAVSRQHLIGWSPLTGRLWGAWSDICKFAGISRAF